MRSSVLVSVFAHTQVRRVTKLLKTEDKLWPGLREDLSSQVLHIPAHAVAKLKVCEMCLVCVQDRVEHCFPLGHTLLNSI